MYSGTQVGSWPSGPLTSVPIVGSWQFWVMSEIEFVLMSIDVDETRRGLGLHIGCAGPHLRVADVQSRPIVSVVGARWDEAFGFPQGGSIDAGFPQCSF
jgi:hypothetical protein